MDSKYGQLVLDLHPEFKVPKRPFKRMDYKEAIAYCKEHDIKKEDGEFSLTVCTGFYAVL